MDYKATGFPFTIMDVASLLRLNLRREGSGHIYVDCPICGDRRGKMNLNLTKNVWRCNYCGEGGGMLALYAKVYRISNSDAYKEICDALQTGSAASAYSTPSPAGPNKEMPQAERAYDVRSVLDASPSGTFAQQAGADRRSDRPVWFQEHPSPGILPHIGKVAGGVWIPGPRCPGFLHRRLWKMDNQVPPADLWDSHSYSQRGGTALRSPDPFGQAHSG